MYREFFPVTRNLIYLNHAAVAPLCRPAAEAMQGLAQDALDWGSLHYDQWLECYEGLRRGAARLVNGTPEEIAIVKNTSEGIATVAMGLDWRAGDKIVAFEEEFPANQYPWRRLESKGVKIEWLPATATLWSGSTQAARGARLLAISFVQFLTGYRADLAGDRRDLPAARRHLSRGRDPGPGRVPGGRAGGAHRRAGGRRPQVAAGAGGLRHPLYLAAPAGAGGAGGVRLDQRGRLQRLRQPRHDAAARCRALRVRDAQHDRLLWAARGDRFSAGGGHR